jgi:nucleoside-diphosphate-sugar epimerase
MTSPGPGSPTRVLVTGAAGRLGSTVVRHLRRAGFDITATDITANDTVTPSNVDERFVVADLLDHRIVTELLDGIEVLLHVGNHPGIGRRPPQQVFNENVSMNENVFQGAAEQGVSKIVFCSTLQLIGSHPDQRTVVDDSAAPGYPLDEDTVPDPSNVYALSKTVSEVMLRYYARRCGIDCIALRFPLLHHGEGRFRVVPGEQRPSDVLEGFTGLTYDDAADLMVRVIGTELPGYRVYVPATAHRHRFDSTADLIAAHYPGLSPDLDDLVDLSTIVRETGWRPADTVPWHDEPGPTKGATP